MVKFYKNVQMKYTRNKRTFFLYSLIVPHVWKFWGQCRCPSRMDHSLRVTYFWYIYLIHCWPTFKVGYATTISELIVVPSESPASGHWLKIYLWWNYVNRTSHLPEVKINSFTASHYQKIPFILRYLCDGKLFIKAYSSFPQKFCCIPSTNHFSNLTVSA